MPPSLVPGPRPGWVRVLNALGSPDWIPLDEDSLLAEATRRTGLSDFGPDDFREPLRVLLGSLEEEAQLHLVGRVLTRSDLLNLLESRLRVVELARQHPELSEERIERPLFITGLPRTGTTILHEVLGQDPASRVPLAWEVRYPWPADGAATAAPDPRIERADAELRFWNEVVPEYPTMHELGARVPVECIVMMAGSLRSDELSGRHPVPRYAAWLAQADLRPAYLWHRRLLQVLQWQRPAGRWVLKAPSHLGSLQALFAVYPDARVVQTHRDPLRVMGSVASILFATAWVRSDAVDPDRVRAWFSGEVCAAILEAARTFREAGDVDPSRFFDVRYADFMRDPIASVAGLYEHFGWELGAEAEARMRAHLAARPQDRHGTHRYSFESTGLDLETERRRFAAYQERYGVASEL